LPVTAEIIAGASYNKPVGATWETGVWDYETRLSAEDSLGATAVASTAGMSGGYFYSLADIVADGFDLASALPATGTVHNVKARIRIRFPEILEDGSFLYDVAIPVYTVKPADKDVVQPTFHRDFFIQANCSGQDWFEIETTLYPYIEMGELLVFDMADIRDPDWQVRIGSGHPSGGFTNYGYIFIAGSGGGGGGGGGGGLGEGDGIIDDAFLPGPWVPGPTINALFEVDWVKVWVDYTESESLSISGEITGESSGAISPSLSSEAQDLSAYGVFEGSSAGSASPSLSSEAQQLSLSLASPPSPALDIDFDLSTIAEEISALAMLAGSLKGSLSIVVDGGTSGNSQVIIVS